MIATPPSIPTAPWFPVVTRTLENGLRLVVVEDPGARLAAVRLSFHAGSADDPPSLAGCAHLAEHLAAQGTEAFPRREVTRRVKRRGGAISAMTWFDWTSFAHVVPPAHLEEALRVEADRLRCLLPSLSAGKLAAERRVVSNERRQNVEGRPLGAVHETLRRHAFPPGHPYRRSILGRPESLRRIELEDVVRFVSARYRPDNAVLVVGGPVDAASVAAQVRRRFGPAEPRGPDPGKPVRPSEPEGGSRQVLREPGVGPSVYAMYPAPAVAEPEFEAALVLSSCLGGGADSVLHRELVRERGIAGGVGATLLPTERTGILHLCVRGRPGVEPGELETALLDVGEQLRDGGPPAELLQGARRRLRRRRLTRLGRAASRSFLVARDALLRDRPRDLDRWPARIQAVDPASVRSLARRFLRRERASTLRVAPRRGADAGRVPPKGATALSADTSAAAREGG